MLPTCKNLYSLAALCNPLSGYNMFSRMLYWVPMAPYTVLKRILNNGLADSSESSWLPMAPYGPQNGPGKHFDL